MVGPETFYMQWNINWSASMRERAYSLCNQMQVFKGKAPGAGIESLSIKAMNDSLPCGFHGTFCLPLLPATGVWVLGLR